MEFTVQQIAGLLQGQVQGDGNATVNRLAKIEEGTPGALSFLSNAKYEPYLYTTGATAVIVSNKLELKQAVQANLILVEDPYTAFSTLLEVYQQAMAAQREGVEEPCYLGHNSSIGDRHYRGAFSYIGKNCRIGSGVHIYPHVYIGDNVTIGDNCILFAGAKVYPDTVIGNSCTLHAGAVIGSDGFGFAPQKDGSYKAIPQIGNVVLEDHVSIGANTTVDCATMGSTIIREGSKIDNLVQIAHNVEIGKHTVVAAQTGISGSSKIGNHCTIAGQVGIVGHITIADKTIIGAQSGVSKSIKETGTFIQGSPAFDYKQNLRALSVFRKLPELQKQLDELREKR
ncbi:MULTISPECIES: UDP-3-O-(3-hydroxymyristoyl)glucosamine N-acyltransferase [Rufibacter]|uniref:UDP-3-O-acylglucosamine N-acyltransferase n=1 Tax=Rufibacter quisquiliarum TaxID=1549639 RepID=A0A839GIJ4_9BACT|nr:MULTISPECIES: UDP-3-O-(3-hydroxymyristoyl)glucosamine N-acyltransferase [Rufibacter]MBA9075435.1 UDP-3-O-[3-hydroxymyristoyl] glucosamine N-acyltransferase [Rufibacter quisquiliarum]